MTVQTGLDTKPVAETEDAGAMGHIGLCVEGSVDGLQVRHGNILELPVELDVAVNCFQLVEGQGWIIVAVDREASIDA